MTQIETLQTTAEDPRFALTVDDVTVRVTRFGTDDEGRTWFEIASFDDYPNSKHVRDVFPTDYGYVKNGEVYMQIQDWNEDGEEFHDERYHPIGPVEQSRLRPGDSLAAELQASHT